MLDSLATQFQITKESKVFVVLISRTENSIYCFLSLCQSNESVFMYTWVYAYVNMHAHNLQSIFKKLEKGDPF